LVGGRIEVEVDARFFSRCERAEQGWQTPYGRFLGPAERRSLARGHVHGRVCNRVLAQDEVDANVRLSAFTRTRRRTAIEGLIAFQATVFTHQLELLLRLTNGLDRLRGNEEHWRLFNMVNRWVPAWRYSADISNSDDAKDFLAAVEKIAHWIEFNI